MSKRLQDNLPFLKKLHCCKAKQRKTLLSHSKPEQVKTIADCCHNILLRNIKLSPAQIKRLKKHKHIIRAIGTKGLSLKKKKKILVQKGGFLATLLTPLIGIATSLLGGLLNK